MDRLVPITVYPRPTRWSDAALPMPEDAPVIRTLSKSFLAMGTRMPGRGNRLYDRGDMIHFR